MENAVAVRQSDEVGIFKPPDTVLDNAMTAAKALMRVVSLKKKPVIMNGEQYLEYEDWQTCGEFYGYAAKTGDAVLVDIDGVKGAKAHADLIDVRTGEVIGGAEAYCMRDEEHWSTRPKYEWQGEGNNRKRVKVGEEIVPWFQLASMAQTRAGAKAFRNRLAWVVVMAGYRPTPAEEMSEGTVSEAVKERRTVDKSEHYCTVHGANFFKSGRMKGYAHKIDGTNEWCNEPQSKTAVADPEEEPKEKQEAPPQPPQRVLHPSEGEPSIIDLEWLDEQLKTLQAQHGLKSWSNANVLASLNRLTNRKDTDLHEAVRNLTNEQAEKLTAKIQETLEMS